MITLLLVDDQAAVRVGLKLRLSLEADMQVVGEAGNGRDAITLAQQLQPDVVVLDLRMPSLDGVAATTALRAQNSRSAIIILTMQDNATCRVQAKAAGAVAFVPKQGNPEKLIAAIRAAAMSGPTHLHKCVTPQENKESKNV